jgi:hypothetical protein
MNNIVIPWNDARIPDWVNWAAIDADGGLTFFEDRPTYDGYCGYWDSKTGKYFMLPRDGVYLLDYTEYKNAIYPRNVNKIIQKTEIKKPINTPEIQEYIKRLNLDPDKKYKFASDIMSEEDD